MNLVKKFAYYISDAFSAAWTFCALNIFGIISGWNFLPQGVQNKAADIAEKLRNWKACHHEKLPGWMKDNEHLHFGHRPEMPSFYECFKSVFR